MARNSNVLVAVLALFTILPLSFATPENTIRQVARSPYVADDGMSLFRRDSECGTAQKTCGDGCIFATDSCCTDGGGGSCQITFSCCTVDGVATCCSNINGSGAGGDAGTSNSNTTVTADTGKGSTATTTGIAKGNTTATIGAGKGNTIATVGTGTGSTSTPTGISDGNFKNSTGTGKGIIMTPTTSMDSAAPGETYYYYTFAWSYYSYYFTTDPSTSTLTSYQVTTTTTKSIWASNSAIASSSYSEWCKDATKNLPTPVAATTALAKANYYGQATTTPVMSYGAIPSTMAAGTYKTATGYGSGNTSSVLMVSTSGAGEQMRLGLGDSMGSVVSTAFVLFVSLCLIVRF